MRVDLQDTRNKEMDLLHNRLTSNNLPQILFLVYLQFSYNYELVPLLSNETAFLLELTLFRNVNNVYIRDNSIICEHKNTTC